MVILKVKHPYVNINSQIFVLRLSGDRTSRSWNRRHRPHQVEGFMTFWELSICCFH